MNETTYTVYELGPFTDYPSGDMKIATFCNPKKAVEYVELMGSMGLRYGVYDTAGNRIDEE